MSIGTWLIYLYKYYALEKYTLYQLKKKGINLVDPTPEEMEKMTATFKEKIESVFSVENLTTLTGSVTEKVSTLTNQIMEQVKKILPEMDSDEFKKLSDEVQKELTQKVKTKLVKEILDFFTKRKKK